jgi:transglutaminase-like putative cysteine protease
MAPGNISQLAQSDEITFRVKFTDPAPPNSKLYWRGVVLGNYDGRTWTPLQLGGMLKQQVTIHLRSAPIRYQVTLEPHGRHWLFALEVPQAVPQLLNNLASVSQELQLRSAQPINERVRYDVVSHVDFELQVNEPARALQLWLELPPGFNPRTLEYAARLRRQSTNDADMVNTVLRLFHEQNFRYTLEPPSLGKHAVDEFLFDTRAGFCEHYSSAFVVLIRALGIPARVITGYQGGSINPADGFMTVRQSDAHAWAEVWLANRGWIRVDPTAAVAPDRVEQNLSSVIPRRMLGGLVTLDPSSNRLAAQWLALRQNWEAVTNGWNQWVLNYTPEKQRDFVKSLGFENADWRTMTTLMFVLGIAVMAAVVLPLILRQRKRDPLDAIYQALCERMAKYGLPRAIHEGPRAYGARLTADESPLHSDKKVALARFLELYETVRYGAANMSPSSALSNLKSLLAECR